MRKQLKFGERAAISVYHVGRDTSVRYDDEKNISAGDELDLTTAEGDHFATVEVQATVTGTVEFVAEVIERNGWGYPRTEPEAVAAGLDPYYDPTITTETRVKGIHFPERLE